MYDEYQIVKSVRELSRNVPKDCIGTIVFVHTGYPQAYEVEFFDADDNTVEVLTVIEEDIIC